MSETNLQIRLASRPEGRPGDENFEITHEPVPAPEEGQVLVRNLYLSLDPAMRGWMSDRKSYIEPIGIGDVMRGLTVGEVIASKAEGFEPGNRVSGSLGWQEYACVAAEELHTLPRGLPLPLFLGPLGMTGLTAYFGLLDIGQPKEGETVVVSAAAGAVGSMVGQIAKIHGCRTVGIAGGAEKCSWLLDEYGFDEAVDYKADNMAEALGKACPNGIDIYFDNVGGEILDAALRYLNRGGRIPLCGAISQYNATEPVPGPYNYLSLLINRGRMEGFIVFDFRKRYGEALEKLGQWVQEGKIHARYDVVDGLENAPRALLKLFDGENTGKLMVKIAEESV
ncbi:MAG: NADP-dependent oxidoreductase [Holophagales bacterium]|nr:NADP-dependent oxidoreductase [Holophagales bacterium]